jgi:hypothetical protein
MKLRDDGTAWRRRRDTAQPGMGEGNDINSGTSYFRFRQQIGHDWACYWLNVVANDPKPPLRSSQSV